MDWVSGNSNKSKTTTTYGKKKTPTFGSKACGGIASFTSLSSIGEDVDDVDFSRTTDVLGSNRCFNTNESIDKLCHSLWRTSV